MEQLITRKISQYPLQFLGEFIHDDTRFYLFFHSRRGTWALTVSTSILMRSGYFSEGENPPLRAWGEHDYLEDLPEEAAHWIIGTILDEFPTPNSHNLKEKFGDSPHQVWFDEMRLEEW